MAALRNLVGKIRIPGAVALRSSRSQAPSPSPSSIEKSEIKKALLARNNIESANDGDLRSNGDLIAKHADKILEAISQELKKQDAIWEKFNNLAIYKYFCSAILLGCINRMADYYWKDKPDQEAVDRAALAGLELTK